MSEKMAPMTLADHFLTTAIAIDRDNKNSQLAVKWAVDNLLNRKHQCILIHVRTQSLNSMDSVPIPEGGRPPTEAEMHQLFLPYRGLCARKGIKAKEVVLHDIEVSSAILDYINNNSVSNIVVGASRRNAITRKLRNADVATTLSKIAPEFCTVYVISKGKVQSSCQSASQPSTPSGLVTSMQPSPRRHSQNFPPESPVSEDIARSPSRGSWRSVSSDGSSVSFDRRSVSSESSDSFQITPRNKFSSSRRLPSFIRSMEYMDASICVPGNLSHLDSPSVCSNNYENLSFLSTTSSDNMEYSFASGTSMSSVSSRGLEAEMKKLKLDLKQSMEVYNSACKEAILLKRERELHQWRAEEAWKLEQAKHAEGVALAKAEMEKQRYKAALEAAQLAQRLAELEVQERRNAEMMAKREEKDKNRIMEGLVHGNIQYRRYTVQEIEVATDYFSNSLKIGEGGYGPVYKASLDHMAVAIKVLRPDISQGQKQFQQEVNVLSSVRHPNMVTLVGACPENGCLVYDYMENGSLEDRLFRKNNTPSIPLRTRFKIAAEISTALLFLHQTKPEPLVHRDLKPANILLDHNYVSKISDVGLARLVPASVADTVTQYHMTAAAGTFCYIDPEYQQTGMLGVKSDVYSLGVVLLQIITARPPMGLTHQVEQAIESGNFLEVLDPTVTDWSIEEALSFAKLALQCCELRRKDRPDLCSVVVPKLNRISSFELDNEADCINNSNYEPEEPEKQEEPESCTWPPPKSDMKKINARKRWTLLKPLSRKWSWRTSNKKAGSLQPHQKQDGKSNKKYHEACWSCSFVGCSAHNAQLRRLMSL